MNCSRCHVAMLLGKAIAPTIVAGISDFGDGDLRGQTLTASGPGVLVDVLKCPKCGYSRTPTVESASMSEPRRIDQTVLGPKGNCQSACIAMLLGLRLDEVPNFNDHADYNGAMQDFLKRRGYTILTFPIGAIELRAFQKGFAIVGGMSPRGHNHAVLYLDGELWHDPHPDRGGVEVSAMDVVYPLRPFAPSPLTRAAKRT